MLNKIIDIRHIPLIIIYFLSLLTSKTSPKSYMSLFSDSKYMTEANKRTEMALKLKLF